MESIFKSGIGAGTDLLVHAPAELPDLVSFDYSIYLAGDLLTQGDLYPVVFLDWHLTFANEMLNPGSMRYSLRVRGPGGSSIVNTPITKDINGHGYGSVDVFDLIAIQSRLFAKRHLFPQSNWFNLIGSPRFIESLSPPDPQWVDAEGYIYALDANNNAVERKYSLGTGDRFGLNSVGRERYSAMATYVPKCCRIIFPSPMTWGVASGRDAVLRRSVKRLRGFTTGLR